MKGDQSLAEATSLRRVGEFTLSVFMQIIQTEFMWQNNVKNNKENARLCILHGIFI